ncbi:metalloprotease PmbA [Luteimonas sp. SJ-92]|uniref:Metalloprotease PmbA n=1 Tax=Luteimonas salinisoli TaxID=2752307 RepID=A0A853JI15_9GAMM|nr:metalloprotease PmbA [Luteimonas salinisoli]NZA28060.1 metalloprotease PmbA [Luteimonas salinisoli]
MTDIALTPVTSDDSALRLERMRETAQRMLALARAAGASQVEVSCTEERGLTVGVRMGEVETVEATRDRGIGLTVYFGRRKGTASTADLREESLRATVEQACAIARFTEEDPAAGLADAALMAGEVRQFDTWHPWALDAERAAALALACEAGGRDYDARIANSDGASVGSGESLSVYANSHGFTGVDRDTQHSIGCGLIAGRGDRMQRDGWYSIGLAEGDLDAPVAIGRKAAQRALARLDPRPVPTGKYPVLFAAEMARSLVGHLLGAVSGGAQYRRASFLLDSVGERLFPEWMTIRERPFLMRGFRSTSFDDDGVATRESPLVEDGVLQRYVLGSYAARKLGLRTTGNAGGVHNIEVASNAGGFEELVRGMGRGLVVTELMGQGVNPVTGDYSRGASGLWVEDGAVAHAVDGITVAGNLRAMFGGVEAVGNDVDPRSHIRTGSIMIGRMTVAGGD